MNTVHIKDLDLNLLVVAHALFRHRNVSTAAAELGVSQSAVSHALARLRNVFGDPLFVRVSRGIAPTDFARGLQSELADWVEKSQSLVARKSVFDPQGARGRIVISSTDYLEIVVLAKLLPILEREAPHVQISLRPTGGALPKRELEEGQMDLAIAGFYRDLPEGFFQTRVFDDHFYCAVGKGHRLFRAKSLGREDFLASRQALITLQGDFQVKSVSGGKLTKERQFRYGSYSFTGMAWMLQSSDLLVSAPGSLLREYAKFFPIKMWPSPVEQSTIEQRMVWHAQTHKDPLRKWVREKLKEVCATIGSKNAS